MRKHLGVLRLRFVLEHHQALAQVAVDKHWTHPAYLSVLFTGAIEIVNTLSEAQAIGSVKRALNHCIKPQVLCIDELGYLPIDKFGTDCLLQVLSHRYERGSTLITTNLSYSILVTRLPLMAYCQHQDLAQK